MQKMETPYIFPIFSGMGHTGISQGNQEARKIRAQFMFPIFLVASVFRC